MIQEPAKASRSVLLTIVVWVGVPYLPTNPSTRESLSLSIVPNFITEELDSVVCVLNLGFNNCL